MYKGDNKDEKDHPRPLVVPAILQEEPIPDQFICPVSLELMEDPVMAADGFSYERKIIEDWFKKGKDTSPMTGAKLQHVLLTANINLRQLIEIYQAKKAADKCKAMSDQDLLLAIQLQQKSIEHYQETNGQLLKSAQEHTHKLQAQLRRLQDEQIARDSKHIASQQKADQYIQELEKKLHELSVTHKKREEELQKALEKQKSSLANLEKNISEQKNVLQSNKKLTKKNKKLTQAFKAAQERIEKLNQQLLQLKSEHAAEEAELTKTLQTEKKKEENKSHIVEQKSDAKSAASNPEQAEDDGYYSEDEDPHSYSALELDALLQLIHKDVEIPYSSNAYLNVLATTRKREIIDNCVKYKKNKSYNRSLEYSYNDRLLHQISQNIWNYTVLDLRGQSLDDEAIIKLAKALETNTHIKKLNVAWNKFGVIGARALAANKTLVALLMFHNLEIGDEGAKVLATNNTWQALDVSSCNIQDEGVEALAANKSLIALSIMGNSFPPAKNFGLKGITALANNKTLTILAIGWNYVGDAGATLLAANKNLIALDVQRCNMGPVAAKAFAANKTLRHLNLKGNHIGNEGAKALAENQTLASLTINENNFNETSLKCFASNQALTSFYSWQYSAVCSEQTSKEIQAMLKRNQENKKSRMQQFPAQPTAALMATNSAASYSFDAKHFDSAAGSLTFFPLPKNEPQSRLAADVKTEVANQDKDLKTENNMGCTIS